MSAPNRTDLGADEQQRAGAERREALAGHDRRLGHRPARRHPQAARISSRATPTADTSSVVSRPMPTTTDGQRGEDGQLGPVVGVRRLGRGGRPPRRPSRSQRRLPVAGDAPATPARLAACLASQSGRSLCTTGSVGEVAVRRRRARGPLEGPGVPGVVAGRLADQRRLRTMLTTKRTMRGADDVGADRRDQVERAPAEVRRRRCTGAAACPARRARTSA